MEEYIKNEKIKYDNIIDIINDKRNLTIENAPKTKLISFFEENNTIDGIKDYNEQVINFRSECLRLMSYNVHFGTNHKTKGNIDNIVELIKKINPDILYVNEITTNETEFNEKGFPNNIGNLINFSFCSFIPSWFESPYGLAIYINAKLIEYLYKSKVP
jgi:hypothetical protein